MTLLQDAPRVDGTAEALATLALDLCVDDALAERYRVDPASVLTARGLPESARSLLGDLAAATGRPGVTSRVPGITWCFSTPDARAESVA